MKFVLYPEKGQEKYIFPKEDYPSIKDKYIVKGSYHEDKNIKNLTGFHKELKELYRLIRDDQAKIINVYGPPGIGKTCITKKVINYARNR
jgi:Cdc6-like AAA superfamily ATPase